MHVEIYLCFISLTCIHFQLIMGAKLLPVCFVIFLFWGKVFYLLDDYFLHFTNVTFFLG